MGSFRVDGGHALSGEITPQGAKNEALQVIAAALLTPQEVTIENIPDIHDVNRLLELMRGLGVEVTPRAKKAFVFRAKDVNLDYLSSPEFKEKGGSLRGSILILGPLISRFGKVALPKPGGDKIGRRRIDTHLLALEKLGAKFEIDQVSDFYGLKADKLKGNYIHLEEASVTGTANTIMAASLAEGTTTVYNAACEPYIQQLCKMINSMGGKISGVGSNLLKIEGVEGLAGTSHRILPDMIEIGSFIGMAAMTASSITIKNCSVASLGLTINVFKKLGIKINIVGDDIIVPEQAVYEIEHFLDGSILTIADAPWPGVSPDLLSVLLVVATQARGSVLIHQKMFESRLFFVDKLIDMGAQIILCDPHRATVIGLERKISLRGIEMSSPDIRAGISLLIAAMSAHGVSTISNIQQIDRGYERIDQRLIALGARIERLP